MLIRIVKDWQYPGDFFRQIPAGGQVWNGITFTEEAVEHCDYLIVLQRPPYDIFTSCPEGNAWLIIQEPPVAYFRFYQKAFPYFDRVFSYYTDIRHPSHQSLQPVLPWHVHKSFDQLAAISRKDLHTKQNKLCWITSNKNSWPGHQARMLLKDALLHSSLPFQLMGNGFQAIDDKFDGLFPCKYAVAIENYSCQDYWTEKLADCFLSWCLPFYWGAPNISRYFPEESFICLDPRHPEEAVDIIRESMAGNAWEKRLHAIAEARHLVLHKYQFFPFVADMVRKDGAQPVLKPLKNYEIPANPYPRRYIINNQIKYYRKRLSTYFNLY